MELAGHAHLPKRPAHFAAAERRAGAPEKGRQVHAVAGVDEPLAELGHARVQPRHFMHYDDRATGARPIHLVRASPVSERRDIEPWHRIGHGSSRRSQPRARHRAAPGPYSARAVSAPPARKDRRKGTRSRQHMTAHIPFATRQKPS